MTPSRARYTLLRFAFALSAVTFLDRVCIASAAPFIREELHLTAVEMGWVFSAFTLAYAIFEVPSGWLGDTIGPRKVLTRIVLWWSAFTMATGLVWSFASLLTFRFLFGAGEAGAFPNTSRSFSRWFPINERGRAHGIIFMGTRLGGAVAPPLAVALIAASGWRASFWIFGSLGLFWAFRWWKWFRDDPSDHPSVNASELELIQTGRGGAPVHPKLEWRYLLNRNLLFICLMYFSVGYGLYFYLTWLPTYLREARGFSASAAGLLAGLVLLAGAVTSMLGGLWTDHWVKRRGLKIGRCAVAAIALPSSGLVLTAAALTDNSLASALLIALAAGLADLSMSASWAMCLDIGRDYAGTVTACMNTFGNTGGAIGPIVMGYSVQWLGSWRVPLLITALIYVLGGVFALLVNPNKPLMGSGAQKKKPEARSRGSRKQLAAFPFWLLASGFWLLFLCSAPQHTFASPVSCQLIHPIVEDDSLSELSEVFFGNASYGPAILLATNARASEAGYRFISDPDNLPAGGNACIPALPEAETLRSRYESYLAAVYDIVLPTPADVSDALVAIDPRSPARLVTWMRTDQVEDLKDAGGNWLKEAPSDIWVVPASKLKSFCEEFEKAHPYNPDLLTLRLEQRLGLPPGANKTLFVDFRIEDPSATRNLFRPCMDPSVTATTCTLGPPAADVGEEHQNWIYRQYYNSFGVARPLQHPWTSLGYTFDWAPDEAGRSRFVKIGESEFVIPQGASMEIQSATPTTEYCSAQ